MPSEKTQFKKKNTPHNKGKYLNPIIDGKKECNTCQKMLPLDRYSKGNGAGGLQQKCKSCQKEYYNTYQKTRRKEIGHNVEEPQVEEKTCSWCGGTFGAEAFHRNRSSWDGLQYNCKLCSSIKSLYHYYRPKPQKVTWEDVMAYKDRIKDFEPAS